MNLNSGNSEGNDPLSRPPQLFNKKPELLYKNAYINFLREFRIRHLDLDTPELFREAADAWIKLPNKDKQEFRCLDIIKAIKDRRAIRKRYNLVQIQRHKRRRLSAHRVMRTIGRKVHPIPIFKRRNRKRCAKTSHGAKRADVILSLLKVLRPKRRFRSRRIRRRENARRPRYRKPHRRSMKRRRRRIRRRRR